MPNNMVPLRLIFRLDRLVQLQSQLLWHKASPVYEKGNQNLEFC